MRSQLSILKQYIKILIVSVILFPLRILPVKKNRILLVSWMGYRFSGNTMYLAKYLAQHYGEEKEIFFAVKGEMDSLQKQNPHIHFIQYGTFAYFKTVMTSKIFVTDGGDVTYVPFKKSQVVVDTWHGGGAYKKVGLAALGDTKLVRSYIRHDSKKYSIYLSSSEKFTEVFSAERLLDKKVFFEVGMPRNDMLVHPDKDQIEEVRNELGVKEHIILYAPTFRDYAEDVYDWGMPDITMDVPGLLENASKRFGGEWRFLYRGHPNAKKLNVENESITDVTMYPDMQKLLLVADILITDYSSSIWDFSLTGKPGFLYVEDLEQYRKVRNFETPIETWPFILTKNNEELLEAMEHFDEDDYGKRVNHHLSSFGNKETGEATRLTVEEMLKRAETV